MRLGGCSGSDSASSEVELSVGQNVIDGHRPGPSQIDEYSKGSTPCCAYGKKDTCSQTALLKHGTFRDDYGEALEWMDVMKQSTWSINNAQKSHIREQ